MAEAAMVESSPSDERFALQRKRAQECKLRFQRKASARVPYQRRWEEIARYLEPDDVGTFDPFAAYENDYNRTEWIYDSDPEDCRDNMVSVFDSLLTPLGKVWFRILPPTDDLNEDSEVREFCQDAAAVVWLAMYALDADLVTALQAFYKSIANYGNGFVYVGANYRNWGLKFVYIPLGECFPEFNHQGDMVGFDRYFRLTAAEAEYQFGADKLPRMMREALGKPEEAHTKKFAIIHSVRERTDDYDPSRKDAKGKRFAAYYVALEDEAILDESGYETMPYIPGHDRKGAKPFARGAGERSLPSIKTLQEMARTDLNSSQMAANPPALTKENAAFAINFEPNALIKGGIDREGKVVVQPWLAGDPRITTEKMQAQRDIISRFFLNHYFKILRENPQMTAAEVYERARKESALMAPPVGQLQVNFLGKLLDRVIDVLNQLGQLPPLPQALAELGGEYRLKYDSPITEAQRADETAGFVRGLQVLSEWITKTGDKSPARVVNMVRSFRHLFRTGGVPEDCLNTDEEISAIDEANAAAQERAQVAAEAPAAAQLIAAADKVTGQEGAPVN